MTAEPPTPAAAPTQARSHLPPELEAFARALAGEPSARVPLERCRALLHALPGGPPLLDPDPRRALALALDALASAGRVRLPSPRSRSGWDREREPPLPRAVVVPRGPRTPRSGPPAALHPLLARARDRATGVRLPDDVAVIDAWLKAHGASAPELPVAERSYEIFGDEKRLDAFLRTRFAAQGGLGPESVRAYRVVEPFAMTELDASSSWAIAVENLATYDSTCRAAQRLAAPAARPSAVIFGRGTQFMLSCASLPDRLPATRRVHYFGDLDATGLEIALTAQAILRDHGVTLAPWTAAYARMLERPASRVTRAPRQADVARLVGFLAPDQRPRAEAVLTAPGRIAQESVPRPELEALVLELSRSAATDTLGRAHAPRR